MAIEKTYTLEEFEQAIELPENADKRFEFIDGEIIEIPVSAYYSSFAALISSALVGFTRNHNLGHVTGEGAGYRVAGWRVSPDVAYVSRARQEALAKKGYNPVAPDLAVEVVSPTDEQWQIRRKLGIYAQAGVLVWLVYPERKIVEVYAPNAPVMIVDAAGVLDGGDVLPGFTLPLQEIFG